MTGAGIGALTGWVISKARSAHPATMGDVSKTKDTRLDRVVAIKAITASRDLDSQARDRFDREARALAALSHPHLQRPSAFKPPAPLIS
jgi:serine/threonine protein kinase